jgi:hypothetical protein
VEEIERMARRGVAQVSRPARVPHAARRLGPDRRLDLRADRCARRVDSMARTSSTTDRESTVVSLFST